MSSQLQEIVVSGMRPTGPLHLGHYFGVLENWKKLQKKYECFFFVADWHALTSEYSSPQRIKGFSRELLLDWFSAGLDPESSVFFVQSQIKEHAELSLILSMLTSLGWLERNPTYKEVKQELVSKDLNTFGFLGYPVLMSADILIYKASRVPVGEDQLPHLEICREIARRFNYLYGELFPEPQAILTQASRLPGLDGRKMSKSYGNTIFLSEDMESVKKKVFSMLTDTNRKRLRDPGNPKHCNLFPYFEILDPDGNYEEIIEGCHNASRGCTDCKKLLFEKLEVFLEPIQKKRKEMEKDPHLLHEILKRGNLRAREVATRTMEQVRKAINLIYSL